MIVLVSGSSGLVGTELVAALTAKGHSVVRLVRSAMATSERTIEWDPASGVHKAGNLEGIDAVVHLAGETIAERWNDEKKARIRDSRVKGTRTLCETLAKMSKPPRVLVSASAVGYYGPRGDEVLTEDSSNGTGFLAEVCRDWEQATEPARQKGIRVAMLRTGVILSPKGGALSKMLLPFQLGVGGVVGTGEQYMSWIALDDEVSAILHALDNASVNGPVNLVAPQAVTNREFTKTLGKVLSRPTFLPMPAFAARLVFGEMADELLLSGQRVEPRKLQSTGFRFAHADLEGALRHLLNKPAA